MIGRIVEIVMASAIVINKKNPIEVDCEYVDSNYVSAAFFFKPADQIV